MKSRLAKRNKGFTLAELMVVLAIVAIVVSLVAQAFLGNKGAKTFGGTTTIDLPPHRKVVTASWKDNSVWVITREAKEDEKPETLTYKEYSNYGIIQGEVILQEH